MYSRQIVVLPCPALPATNLKAELSCLFYKQLALAELKCRTVQAQLCMYSIVLGAETKTCGPRTPWRRHPQHPCQPILQWRFFCVLARAKLGSADRLLKRKEEKKIK